MRSPDRFSRKAMFFSVLIHSGILGLGWLSTLYRPPVFEFVTYEIELVSPAPAIRAEEATTPTQELVVERPEERPPEPEREETPVPVERPAERQPDPEPPPREEPAEQPPKPDEERTKAAAPEAPEEPAKESGEGINVRLEGVRRDYPEYYNNIIRQIQRCFRWQGGGSWETTVYFVITRDGRAGEIEFVTRSGSTAFDFEAMGAVDCAGQGRFGPLPEELPFESLPIQFSFKPTGGARGFFPNEGALGPEAGFE